MSSYTGPVKQPASVKRVNEAISTASNDVKIVSFFFKKNFLNLIYLYFLDIEGVRCLWQKRVRGAAASDVCVSIGEGEILWQRVSETALE